MLDSRGKPESGILDGNRFYEGSYQECIRIKENESDPDAIQGLFCTGVWYNGPVSYSILIMPNSCILYVAMS